MLFVINILPVLPLDGGQAARRLLSGRLGEGRAVKLLSFNGVVAGGVMIFLMLKYSEFSINSLSFALFLVAGVFTCKEKYSRDFVRELACVSERKGVSKCDILMAEKGCDNVKILKKVVPSKGAVIVFLDENSGIFKAVTDIELAKEILG